MDVVQSQRSNFQRSTSNPASSKNMAPDREVLPAKESAPMSDDISSASTPPQQHSETPTHAPSRSRRGPFQRLRRRRRHSAPPGSRRRRPLVEDHFRVGYTEDQRRVILPGVPKHADDWARDSHDFFNLIALIPVVALNIINWNWEKLLTMSKGKELADCWTGDNFDAFYAVTYLYFTVDLFWVLLIPRCVKSPVTIVQHHIATMIYLLVPYFEEEWRWMMGACMTVEVNTWLLIARRVLNKQGVPPWVIDLSFVSIRVKLVSVLFYVTWISIRCFLYPYLIWPFLRDWSKQSEELGTRLHIGTVAIPLHSVFCVLNFKWTYDLLMSKIRYWRRKGDWKEASKGL